VTETFNYRDLLDGLRCRPSDWLADRRDHLVREQRRLHVEELAVVAVLDERGHLDAARTAADDGVTPRNLRDDIETARRLEDLPEVAAAAYAGELSDEQLAPVTRVADPASDAEWARRAPNTSPVDLRRAAHTMVEPTPDEARARYAARSLRMRWDDDDAKRMLQVRGQLPDVMGAQFEQLIGELVEAMKPDKGQEWTRSDQRAADALLQLCDEHDQPRVDDHEPRLVARRPRFSVDVPLHGPATIAGIPIPDAMLEQLRAQASIELRLVDEFGAPLLVGRAFPGLSPKKGRAVAKRDGHCRFGCCDRTQGLEVHHLWPRSWGGTDDYTNLALVCRGGAENHHPHTVPHGPWLLLGNPNQPDGLRLVHRDQISDLDHYIGLGRAPTLDELGLVDEQPERAGPTAA
jgi:hypothetical protein